MNKKRSIAILFIFSLIVFSKCKIPFEPDFIRDISEILVIDGNIAVGDISKIYISTAVPVASDMYGMFYIRDADVSVEDDAGNTYYSTLGYENYTLGSYYYGIPYFEIDSRHFSLSNKYRLVVRCDNNEYATDFLPVIKTPEIKDINFSIGRDKECVYFQVSTEGNDDQSRYYKWRYEEDWEFGASLDTGSGDNSCWNKDVSTDIIIATSKDLEHNVINGHRVNKVLKNERKISRLYRIKLYQMAISGPEYKYLYNVRRNSDEVGGIFGIQPSEMFGNIKCINDGSIDVLGYISCSTVTTMTKYFKSSEIGIYEDDTNCRPIAGNFPGYSDADMEAAGYIVFESGNPTIWAQMWCVDCIFYGTKNRPADWPTMNE